MQAEVPEASMPELSATDHTGAKQHRHLEGDLDRHGDRARRVPLPVALGAAGGSRQAGTQWCERRLCADANAIVLILRRDGFHADTGPDLHQQSNRAARLADPDVADRGLAKPFKPEPERSPYTVTGTNFAAAYKPASAHAAAEPKPTRRAHSLQQQQPAADAEVARVPRWKHIAQNPIAAQMNIH